MEKLEQKSKTFRDPKHVLISLDRLFFNAPFSPLIPNQRFVHQLGIIGLEQASPQEIKSIDKWLVEIEESIGRENFDDFIDEIRTEIIQKIKRHHEHLYHRLIFAKAAAGCKPLPDAILDILFRRNEAEEIICNWFEKIQKEENINHDENEPVYLPRESELLAVKRFVVAKFKRNKIGNEREFCAWIKNFVLPLLPKLIQPWIYLELWYLYCSAIVDYFFKPNLIEKRFMKKLFPNLFTHSNN